MTSYINILVFLILSNHFVLGQCIEVKYQAHHTLKKPPSQNGENTLIIDVPFRKTVYLHDEFPINDSSKTFSSGMVAWVDGDSEMLPIYMNHAENEMIYKSVYATKNKNFIFSDSIPVIKWHLQEDVIEVDGITLFKALGHYGGRDYVAWYNPEIPLPYGPHRFSGLPGLIHEISSEDGLVKFKLVRFSSSTNCNKVHPPQDGIQMDSLTYLKHMVSRLEIAESHGATNNDPPADWDIEKNRHYLNSRIKRKRGY